MKTKKIIAVLFATVFLLISSVSVFADEGYTITISNTSSNVSMKGVTYRAYRLFDLTMSGYDAEGVPSNYAYTINSDFENFVFNSYSGKALVEYVSTLGDESSELNALAKAVNTYIVNKNISESGSVTATEDATAVIDVPKPGYYLIIESATSIDGESDLTAFCALDTTNNSAEVYLKVDTPTIIKQVKESGESAYGTWTDAEIGETVNFLLTFTIPTYADYYNNYTYVIHDSMDNSFTLDRNTLKLYSDSTLNTEVESSNYTVAYENDDSCDFEITFTPDFIRGNTGKIFYVAYDATLNSSAVIHSGSNKNSACVEYSDNAYNEDSTATTPNKEVKVYTYSLDLLKYYTNENTEIPLAGAKFKLFSDADCTTEIGIIKVADNEYRVAQEGETAEEYMGSIEGKITIKGLDDSEYYLEEVAAPSGYNLLVENVKVTVDATATVDNTDVASVSVYQDDNTDAVEYIGIENVAGTLLPFAGGIGATIFYVSGGILVILVVVILITRKRLKYARLDQ